MTTFRGVLAVLPHLLASWAIAAQAPAATPAPAPAPAPGLDTPVSALATDLACYQQNRTVTVAGTGFEVGAPYTVSRDGAALGSGTVGADGALTGTLSSGRLPSGVGERAFTLAAAAGATTASTRYRVTRFSAAFTPRRATPSTQVRFSVFGFGRLAPVYVHYLRPGARSATQTVALGHARGPCGKIARSALRRLFPFRPRSGVWNMQFDTRATYRASAIPRLVLPVTVRG